MDRRAFGSEHSCRISPLRITRSERRPVYKAIVNAGAGDGKQTQSKPNTDLISLALDSGKRQNDHLPSKHFLVKPVAAVFNRRVQIDDLVCDPQFMDDILFGQRKQFQRDAQRNWIWI